MLDERTFTDGGFVIGDAARVLPLPPDRRFTVVGVVEPNGGDPLDEQVVAFGLAGAAAAFGATDVEQVFVRGDEGLDQAELAARIDNALRADGLEAITGETLVGEYQDTIGELTTIISVTLRVFASVSLTVGAFVIYNTFSITVAQRRREMALLRAIGASPRQVSSRVIVESLLVGVVASLVGALVGVGLGWALLQALTALGTGFDVALTVPLATVVGGVALGTVSTLSAAWGPARRGARIAPVDALRQAATDQAAPSRRRTLAGTGLMVVGVATSTAAVIGGELVLSAIGVAATVVAVALVGPAAIRPLGRLIAVPLVRTGSVTGELARENAARNPRRTSTTALTLVVGVALVVAASVFAATVGASTRGQLETQVTADHIVTVGAEVALLGGGLDPTVTPSIADLAGVDAAVPLRRTAVEVLDGSDQMTGTDSARLAAVLDLDVVDGDVTGLAADEVAVAHDRAADEALVVGDRVEVRFPQETVTMRVAGTYRRDELVGAWLADLAAFEAASVRSLDTEVLIRSRDGTGASVAAAVDDVLADTPTAAVETTGTFIDRRVGQIDQLLTLLYGLLAMSVVVALIGIVNTMTLSLYERTRELGLLRAVGMTPRQLRRTVRYESTIIALVGTVVGLALGLFLGWVASRAAKDTFPDLAVPVTSLVVIVVVGVVAGLAAGSLPARRAGRLDVLGAIAGE